MARGRELVTRAAVGARAPAPDARPRTRPLLVKSVSFFYKERFIKYKIIY